MTLFNCFFPCGCCSSQWELFFHNSLFSFAVKWKTRKMNSIIKIFRANVRREKSIEISKVFFSWSSRWGIKIGYERVRQHFRMNKLRSLSHKEASLLDCRREKCKIVKYSQRKFLLQTATSSLSVEKISIFSPLCFLWNVLASDSGGKGDENLIEISLFPSSEIHIV